MSRSNDSSPASRMSARTVGATPALLTSRSIRPNASQRLVDEPLAGRRSCEMSACTATAAPAELARAPPRRRRRPSALRGVVDHDVVAGAGERERDRPGRCPREAAGDDRDRCRPHAAVTGPAEERVGTARRGPPAAGRARVRGRGSRPTCWTRRWARAARPGCGPSRWGGGRPSAGSGPDAALGAQVRLAEQRARHGEPGLPVALSRSPPWRR